MRFATAIAVALAGCTGGGPAVLGTDAGDGGGGDAATDRRMPDGAPDPDARTPDSGAPIDAGFDGSDGAALEDAGPADGGTDSGPVDAGHDGGHDAGRDAGTDAGPAPRVPMVKVGREHSCGLDAAGAIRCWGDWLDGKTFEHSGTFTDLDVGDSHNCAVRDDGRLLCWGLNDDGQREPPGSTCPCAPSCHCVSGGTYTRVATGADFSCGITTAASLECWGATDAGQTSPPSGTFTKVEAGSSQACALRADGAVRCWGDTAEPVPTFTEPVSTLAVTGSGSCAVLADGTAECWGSAPDPPGFSFEYADGYSDQGCGIEVGGPVACWGTDTPPLPSGLFRQMDHGYWAADEHGYCGVTTSGEAVCWGGDGERLDPPGDF